MKIELQIVNTSGIRELVEIKAVKAFEFGGYSFYYHAAYDNVYKYSVTEKTTGLTVHTGDTIKGTIERAKSILKDNAANLETLISKGIYTKNLIATCELFKGAFGIK